MALGHDVCRRVDDIVCTGFNGICNRSKRNLRMTHQKEQASTQTPQDPVTQQTQPSTDPVDTEENPSTGIRIFGGIPLRSYNQVRHVLLGVIVALLGVIIASP